MTPQTITIHRPDEAELQAEYAPLVQRAREMTVATVEEDEIAQTYLIDLRRAEKSIDDRLDPIIKAANSAHKMLTALRASAKAPIESAREIISGKRRVFVAEQRRLAEEAQRKAQAEAERVERERRDREREAALAAAAAAEEAGDQEQAEAALEEAVEIAAEPIVAPVVQVQPQVAKVNGVSMRTTWRAEVISLPDLVRHVARNLDAQPGLINYLSANMPPLNDLARGQRDLLRIPGVRAVAVESEAVRL